MLTLNGQLSMVREASMERESSLIHQEFSLSGTGCTNPNSGNDPYDEFLSPLLKSQGVPKQSLASLFIEQNKNTINNTLCGRLDHTPLFSELIQRIRPTIVQKTLHHVMSRVYNNRYNESTLDEGTIVGNGLAKLIDFWDPVGIRKMMMHSMPPQTIRKLVHIINERLRDPTNNPPLHIMVYGGSIAEGIDADRLDLANITMQGDAKEGRFSTQLELLFNEIIFPETTAPVVKVDNMATGGMTSDIGAFILDYALFPSGYPRQGPDVVIAAFAYNDVNKFLVRGDESQSHQNILQSLQNFVGVAYRNRCDGLPAVIAVDDTFLISRLTVRENLMHSRVVAELSLWHDIMSVSYTKGFLHHFYSDDSLTKVYSKLKEDMFGTTQRNVHPTLFFHTGTAWLIFLPLLQNLHEFCSDQAAGWDEISNERVLESGKKTKQASGLEPRFIPPLKVSTRLDTNLAEWRTNQDDIMAQCSGPNFLPGNTCSYYWMVHKATEVRRSKHVKALIRQVSIFNNGWVSEGNPIRPPRPGWVAQKQNASFGIRVTAKEFPIRKVTIHYMKSYGNKWKDSRLRVHFYASDKGGAAASVESSNSSASLVDVPLTLEGFHDSNTSVQYHTTFDVDAAVGASLAASFTLIGGTTFKIIGMFFCSR